jgi:hypothetical protein
MKKIEFFKETKKKEFKDLTKDSIKLIGGLALLGTAVVVTKKLLIDD